MKEIYVIVENKQNKVGFDLTIDELDLLYVLVKDYYNKEREYKSLAKRNTTLTAPLLIKLGDMKNV